VPLGLGTWAIAWQRLLEIRQPRRLATVFGALTLLCIATQTLGAIFVASSHMQLMGPVLTALEQLLRLLFLVGFGYLFARCLIDKRPTRMVSALAILLLSIGLVASELSAIGIPGIWFPYGTGVSRTQYAFGALALVIPTLIVLQLRQCYRRPIDS